MVAIGLGLFFEIYEIFLSSTISTTLKAQYHLGGTELNCSWRPPSSACSSVPPRWVGSPTGSAAAAPSCST